MAIADPELGSAVSGGGGFKKDVCLDVKAFFEDMQNEH